MILANELRDIASSGNPFIDTLLFGRAFVPGSRITYVLKGNPGDPGASGGAVWAAGNKAQSFVQALDAWSMASGLIFAQAGGPYDASMSTSYDWVESFEALPSGELAEHQLPFTGVMEGHYSSTDAIFKSQYSGAGSLAFTTFLHEIGHGLGLLHPHIDYDEPASGRQAIPGVYGPYDRGHFGLNQGPYTIMSYNDGLAEIGLSPSKEYGWSAGLGAFDVAAMQHIYGPAVNVQGGDNAYQLDLYNLPGTGWRTLLDTGGTDSISAGATAFDAVIDLRPASLLLEAGGGGFISHVAGVLGGFTIANGVTIENATGGSGDDRIHGNAADNRLDGEGGLDTADFSGTAAALVIDLATGSATGAGNDTLISIENAIGGSGADIITARAGVLTDSAKIDQYAYHHVGSAAQGPDWIDQFANHGFDPAVKAGANLVTATVHVGPLASGSIFQLVIPTSGTLVNFDIDNSFGIDTVISILNSAGAVIAQNDDAGNLDAGGANVLDSRLDFTTTQANQHLFVQVMPKLIVYPFSYDLHVTYAGAATVTGQVLLGSQLYGGAGNDQLIGADGIDLLAGEAGDDSINGGAGADTLVGDAGNDLLDGGTGIDTLIGGDGNDRLIGGSEADTLRGGGGNDTYVLTSDAAIIVEEGFDSDTVEAGFSYVLVAALENLVLTGTASLDGTGNAAGNRIDGNAGANLLAGLDGDDRLNGGDGMDELQGGEGNDTLLGGSGADLLIGGFGNDRYVIDLDDTLVELAGGGSDTVVASGYYLLENFENLIVSEPDGFGVGNSGWNDIYGSTGTNLLLGGDGNDRVVGLAGDDALFGEGGNDSLYGESGSDYAVGGSGADQIHGGAGADLIFGEDGDDLLYADGQPVDPYAGPSVPMDIPYGDFVTDILVGGDGDDQLHANSQRNDYDLLDGGAGNDSYYVDTGDDLTFEAVGGGIDTVYADIDIPNAGVYLYANVENLVLQDRTSFGVGNALDNVLTGSFASNWLLGGDGNDRIIGSGGFDVLFGERGADVFEFGLATGTGVIGDFQSGSDRIMLMGYNLDFASLQTFFAQVGSDGAIQFAGGQVIILQGVIMSSLTANDFMFG